MSIKKSRVVTVPDEISDNEEAYTTYAISQLKKYWSIEEKDIILERYSACDFYVIDKNDPDNIMSSIAIRKKNKVLAYDGILIDTANNFDVIVNPIESEDSYYLEMSKKASDKGYNQVLGAYDFYIDYGIAEDDGLNMSFELGSQHNGKQVIVLQKNENETYEEAVKTVENGRISIKLNKTSTIDIPSLMLAIQGEYKLGDVDGDGDIDAQDAVMILKYVAHNIELTEKQLLAANTTKDETVDAQDAVQILKYVAHNITEF